jgi:hypothetical protein
MIHQPTIGLTMEQWRPAYPEIVPNLSCKRSTVRNIETNERSRRQSLDDAGVRRSVGRGQVLVCQNGSHAFSASFVLNDELEQFAAQTMAVCGRRQRDDALVRGCSVYTLRLAERLGDVLGFWLVGGHCTSRYTSYWAYKNLSRQRSSAFKIFVARRKLATPQVLIAQSREFCLKSVFHKFGKGQPGRKTCQVKRGVSRFVDQLCRDIQSGSYFRRRLGRKLRHSSGRLVEVC